MRISTATASVHPPVGGQQGIIPSLRRGGLQVQPSTRSEARTIPQKRRHPRRPALVKGRVREDEVEWSGTALQIFERIDARQLLWSHPASRQIADQQLAMPWVFFNEHHLLSTSGPGLQAQRTAARKKIQHARVGDVPAQPVEQGLAYGSRCGAQGSTRGSQQPPSATSASDDGDAHRAWFRRRTHR